MSQWSNVIIGTRVAVVRYRLSVVIRSYCLMHHGSSMAVALPQSLGGDCGGCGGDPERLRGPPKRLASGTGDSVTLTPGGAAPHLGVCETKPNGVPAGPPAADMGVGGGGRAPPADDVDTAAAVLVEPPVKKAKKSKNGPRVQYAHQVYRMPYDRVPANLQQEWQHLRGPLEVPPWEVRPLERPLVRTLSRYEETNNNTYQLEQEHLRRERIRMARRFQQIEAWKTDPTRMQERYNKRDVRYGNRCVYPSPLELAWYQWLCNERDHLLQYTSDLANHGRQRSSVYHKYEPQ